MFQAPWQNDESRMKNEELSLNMESFAEMKAILVGNTDVGAGNVWCGCG
jgi:hypothetical protein